MAGCPFCHVALPTSRPSTFRPSSLPSHCGLVKYRCKLATAQEKVRDISKKSRGNWIDLIPLTLKSLGSDTMINVYWKQPIKLFINDHSVFSRLNTPPPLPPSRWLFQTWLQGSGICTLTSWLVWQNIKYWLLKYLIVCFYFYSAVTLHSVSFTKEWQQEDSHYNYKIISFLQSCSEYEFKVQVILQGRSPGPFSATVKAKTQTARK